MLSGWKQFEGGKQPMLTRLAVSWMLFAAIMGFASGGGFVWAISQPDQNSQITTADAAPNASGNQHQPSKPWRQSLSIIWDRTWDDPVAFYTFVLGIFTALLAVISAVQIAFLLRADKTTRISANAAMLAANAAKRSVELAEKHERAYLMPGILDFQRNIELKVATFRVSVSNDGRSAGLLKKLCWQFSETEPIGEPSYDGWESRNFDVSFPGNTPAKPLPFLFHTVTDRPQYFTGYIEYIDILKRPHFTRFCLYIVPQMPSFDIAGPPAWSDWD